MKHSFHRFCALALTLTLLLSAGCTPGDGTPSNVAMGRYVECELPLPADFKIVSGLHANADGTLELLGYPAPSAGQNSIYLSYYRSTDGGNTWSEEQPTWLDYFNGENFFGLNYAAWASDGTLWFFIEGLENEQQQYRFARLEETRLVFLDWDVPDDVHHYGLKRFLVAGNGDFILDCNASFLQVNPDDGAVKNVYTTDYMDQATDGWAITDNHFVLSEREGFTWYDLDTGEKVRFLPFQKQNDADSSYRSPAFCPDGALVFAAPQGLYRAIEGNDTLECLVDGKLTSLALPYLIGNILIPIGEHFLLLTQSKEGFRLLSFAYDSDTPTLPEHTITVWSLREDPLIRQALSAFRTRQPDSYVDYQVGLSGEDAVTFEDALRVLSTQIAAGKGPDVLVLDGLPIDSYIEKGVLIDLSTQLDALSVEGDLISGITGAYRRPNGSTYAVPAQFQVPLMHGSAKALASIHDLATMTDYLVSQEGRIFLPFSLYSMKQCLNFFYPPLAHSLLRADRKTDEGALRTFLTQFKRIADLYSPSVDWSSYEGMTYSLSDGMLISQMSSDLNFEHGAADYWAGATALDVGNLAHFSGLYAAWTADNQSGEGRIAPLFDGGLYLPLTALGISAQSTQQDLAWAFIETALSGNVQGVGAGNGIPVSITAFDDATNTVGFFKDIGVGYPPMFNDMGPTVFSNYDPSTKLRAYFPPEEWRKEMAERIKGLDTPIFYDETVLRLIIDNTADYWSGKADLDTTVNAIMQKLTLYEAE